MIDKKSKMKNNIDTPVLFICSTLITLCSNPLLADDLPIYPFISLGISNAYIELNSPSIEFNSSYRPSFSLGLAKDVQFDENWLLTTSVALSYASTDFNQFSNDYISGQGQLTEKGFWASTKIKRSNLFSGALRGLSPFINLSVAAIKVDYQTDSSHTKKVIPGYKITTGLEFELTSHSTFSIGVGYSDFDDLPVTPAGGFKSAGL